MSQESLPGARRLRVVLPMVGRDPEEDHRSSTPLELFFDLVFVVAVAFAAEGLHHGLLDGDVADAVLEYALAFFAIWWAWVNFTWFASAYDTDDVLYRVFVFVSMTGALILAAGVPRIFDERDFTLATLGYVVMRIALVTQWLRAARADVSRRSTARRYAAGVAACQLGWISALALPTGWLPAAWAILVPAELVVPVWAEAASPTTWHRAHISERYGLFMIIVLGESVLAASLAIRSATTGADLTAELVAIIIGGLLIVFSLWWIYFDRPEDHLLLSEKGVFAWGYVHLFVFSSAAAVGAGLVVSVEHAVGHGALGPAASGAAISIPVAVFALSLWSLYVRTGDAPLRKFGLPVTAAFVLASSFTTSPVLLVGIMLAVLLLVKGRSRLRTEQSEFRPQSQE
jgi:low temperature requirement protein LtrA